MRKSMLALVPAIPAAGAEAEIDAALLSRLMAKALVATAPAWLVRDRLLALTFKPVLLLSPMLVFAVMLTCPEPASSNPTATEPLVLV